MAGNRHRAFDRGMIGSAHRGGLQVFAMMPTRFIGGGPPFRGSVNRQTDPAQMQAGQDDRNSGAHRKGKGDLRSEEHTSELQSLMRISYAVFCLKKKQRRK